LWYRRTDSLAIAANLSIWASSLEDSDAYVINFALYSAQYVSGTL
jgi:hypothetical protein